MTHPSANNCSILSVCTDTLTDRHSIARHQSMRLPVDAGLKALQAHARVGALSNIDNASLQSSCRKLDFSFDVVVTAERVGAYKPDVPHFHTGIADLAATGISRERILHVGQSLRADITPANRLGLKCAWINRPGRLLGLSGEGAAEAKPDLTVSSLQELVAAITANNRAVA